MLLSMAGSLALTGLLAWQAYRSALSHRSLAREVLRDYASLAADEYVRRATSQVGYYGYFPLLGALGTWTGEQGRAPDRAELGQALDGRAAEALELVAQVFRLDLTAAATGGPEAILARVREDLPSIGELGRGPSVLPARHAPDSPTLVVARLDADGSIVVGFAVDETALRTWLEKPLEQGSLLPESLASNLPAGEWIGLRVEGPQGGEVFRSGDEPAGALGVDREFGDAYGGVLEGFRTRIWIDSAAASALTTGGLPRSQVPVLLGLAGLALALSVSALWLWRREQALAALRSEFVSRVSHELRTPLSQIRMFAETVLLGRIRSDAEGRRALEIIDREARRLTHLVENILQFSRGERGTARVHPEARELVPLVEQVVREFRPLVDSRRIRIETRMEAAAVAVVDDSAVRQVLLNLLDNAVKYGPDRQTIEVAIEAVESGARIVVEDEGPGVPPGDRERIWGRFRRLDREQERDSAGTGIGLAVVRELVELQRGQAWMEAGARGGARFVVELPGPGDRP